MPGIHSLSLGSKLWLCSWHFWYLRPGSSPSPLSCLNFCPSRGWWTSHSAFVSSTQPTWSIKQHVIPISWAVPRIVALLPHSGHHLLWMARSKIAIYQPNWLQSSIWHCCYCTTGNLYMFKVFVLMPLPLLGPFWPLHNCMLHTFHLTLTEFILLLTL